MDTTECYRSESGKYVPKMTVEMIRDTYREMVKVQMSMREVFTHSQDVQAYNRIVAELANFLKQFN